MPKKIELFALFFALCTLASCARPISSPPLAPPTRPVIVSLEAAQRLETRFSEALSRDGPFQIPVSEEELTSYLAIETDIGPLRDPRVWFVQQRILFTARIDALGQHALCATLTLGSKDGKLQIAFESAELNGKSVPRFVLASLKKAINDALTDAHLPMRIERIIWEEEQLILEGMVEP